MQDEVLKKIIDYAAKELIGEYGYCGVMDGDKAAMLNSDDGKGRDIIINIKLSTEDDE